MKRSLEIIDLQQNASAKSESNFFKNNKSELDIDIDKNKIIRDTEWIEIISLTLPYIERIFRNPNRFIANEEEIIKVEQARKITIETIKHLSKNTNFIQKFNKKDGSVIPSKLLNIRKEEDYNTYENRLIYTLIQKIVFFMRIKKESMLENNDNHKSRNNKTLEYVSNSKVNDEKVKISVKLDSCLDQSSQADDSENDEILKKIEAIETNIVGIKSLDVYKIIDKAHISWVQEPIKRTNVILKNVNFQYAMKLWSYLSDHLAEEDVAMAEQKKYKEEGMLKELFDETFWIQYLIMKTLDEDMVEKVDEREKIQDIIIEQMIDKTLSVNSELTSKELSDLIASKFETIKYKKLGVVDEIQKIFKSHIEKCLEKIEEG